MRYTATTFVLSLPALLVPQISASPVDPLKDIRCHCLTFVPLTGPIPCTVPGSQDLSWQEAYKLAEEKELKLAFADDVTISNVLLIDSPLPASVLLTIANGDATAMESEAMNEESSTIVCGFGDEVRRDWMRGMEDERLQPEDQPCYVGVVLASLLLLIIAYSVGEYVWTRRYFREGQIRLDGDEKSLTIDSVEPETMNPQAHMPNDFS